MRRRVPPELTVAEIAAATGWSTRRVRGKLRRAGLLRRDGRHYVVSRSKLRSELLDVYEDVYEHFELGSASEPPPAP